MVTDNTVIKITIKGLIYVHILFSPCPSFPSAPPLHFRPLNSAPPLQLPSQTKQLKSPLKEDRQPSAVAIVTTKELSYISFSPCPSLPSAPLLLSAPPLQLPSQTKQLNSSERR